MLLAIDVGNSNIKLGVYEGDMLYFISRIATDAAILEDQYAIEIKDLLQLYNIDCDKIDSVIISSVVPKITEYLTVAVKKLFGVDAVIVDYNIYPDLEIAIKNPEETGADLIAGAVAAKELYSSPCIVIDMGTATKLIVMDKEGRMLGGCIIPGVGISMDALFHNAALLSAVGLKAPGKVIGNSTVTCIQSGIVYGTAAMIDGLCDKIEAELGYSCRLIATGGLAETVIKNCRREIEYSDTLLLEGLKIIYEKVSK